jgi:hypothetical protein
MRRHAFDLAVILVVGTLVIGYLLLSETGWRSVLVRVYIFFLGALVLFALLSASSEWVPRARRSEFELALPRGAPKRKPLAEVERVTREVGLATSSAYDLHTRLLPHLREIAACRLERSGRSAGPETLGRWWDLLRPDRPAPVNHHAPGIKEADLRALVSDLERL